MKVRAVVVVLAISILFLGCSTKKPGVIDCEKNEDCPASFKCDQERGRCVDIYFPNLGSGKGV